MEEIKVIAVSNKNFQLFKSKNNRDFVHIISVMQIVCSFNQSLTHSSDIFSCLLFEIYFKLETCIEKLANIDILNFFPLKDVYIRKIY
jgi:hypothetical protein